MRAGSRDCSWDRESSAKAQQPHEHTGRGASEQPSLAGDQVGQPLYDDHTSLLTGELHRNAIGPTRRVVS
jgi:hypothetical protein